MPMRRPQSGFSSKKNLLFFSDQHDPLFEPPPRLPNWPAGVFHRDTMSIYRRALAYYRPFLGKSLIATGLILLLIPFNLLKPLPLIILIAALGAALAVDAPPTNYLGQKLTLLLQGYDLPTLIAI